jgi:hypothetical protein
MAARKFFADPAIGNVFIGDDSRPLVHHFTNRAF